MKVPIASGPSNTTLWVILVGEKIIALPSLGLKENISILMISLYFVAF